jgi:tRNA-2-methylthio-N6-dimethylallyladenosine synthase
MKKNVACVINYGCQMNEYESQTVSKMLMGAGFEMSNNPDDAEVVILNTCTVRDNADLKVWHKLEHLLPQKRRSRRQKKIGLMGCMVAAQKEALMQKHPEIDFLITPAELQSIGKVLADVTARRFEDYSTYEVLTEGNAAVHRSYLPVQTGCNFNCTYCIVPAVKGREVNLSSVEILNKVHELVTQGVQEITLLGQTINSWRHEGLRFADLLARVAQKAPKIWIRFLTSHPVLFDDKILEVMRDHPNLCPWIHIPAQSGSSRVLKAMKRGYSREAYLELILKIRETVPGVCLSTDMICGFPSETEEEFLETLSLLREVKYETAYLFHYSERQGTVAASMEGSMPEEIRKERLARMIAVQREVQTEIYPTFIGRTEKVLVESEAKRFDNQYKGRTSGNVPVLFQHKDNKIGSFVNVKIGEANSQSLFGEVV